MPEPKQGDFLQIVSQYIFSNDGQDMAEAAL